MISIPDFSLVVLVGASGSGKSTFAAKHFLPSEALSSDGFRAMVSDDANDQAATADAFDALHHLAAIRLRRPKLVVIDATNVQPSAREPLVELARRFDCLPVAIVLNVSERTCTERNRSRPDRQFGNHVIRNHHRWLRQSLRGMRREGFRHVFVLDEAEIAAAEIVRTPLWTDRRADHGPFDIIGDVHGCYQELTELLAQLGYTAQDGAWRHPAGRRALFLGDLVDRGPAVVECVETARSMVEAASALCIPGNHDVKLMRALKGNPVRVSHGLQESLDQIAALPEQERAAFTERTIAFLDSLVSHYWLDGGRLCVAHAGLKEEYIGRASRRVRDFALYGDVTGETDDLGLPVRYPWAEDYRGQAAVVYGHTPVARAEWLNNTINIDTGCVFGGSLTALRWPEKELVSVPARRTYAESPRPLERAESPGASAEPHSAAVEGHAEEVVAEPPITPPAPSHPPAASGRGAQSLQWQHDELLRAEDLLGKRFIETRFHRRVTIPAENAAAAFEVMSRFAADPRWLIYLPPTMAPCETAPEGELLERPEEAFAYFRSAGVETVVCQRKHMGSRAVVVICRSPESAAARFGEAGGRLGVCLTRTGREFFDDGTLNHRILAETARAAEASGLWDELETDWLCLDCELMPWNAKAGALLREQYAPVAAAGRSALAASAAAVRQAEQRGIETGDTLGSLEARSADMERYAEAYGRYCWEGDGIDALRIAPFHIMASEGRTYFDKAHPWHITTLSRLAEASSLFMSTEALAVEPGDAASVAAGSAWWHELTESGGEGMVVKPVEFIAMNSSGPVQPAVKVRGREYLRIIYGPDYTEPQNLSRLRQRGLGAKRSLALREFALGAEALERFVRRQPLRHVHECVFGVLALESEPVDPRL